MRRAGGSNPIGELTGFCAQTRPALIITDENPLRASARWRVAAAQALDVPLLSVDADVVVPSAIIGREQYAARTIRPRIHAQLNRFLQPIGNQAVRVAWDERHAPASLEPSANLLGTLSIDQSVPAAPDFRGGTTQALRALKRFVAARLDGYATRRNHPEADGTSRLSPYLHFGQIGPHTVALAAMESDAASPGRDRAGDRCRSAAGPGQGRNPGDVGRSDTGQDRLHLRMMSSARHPGPRCRPGCGWTGTSRPRPSPGLRATGSGRGRPDLLPGGGEARGLTATSSCRNRQRPLTAADICIYNNRGGEGDRTIMDKATSSIDTISRTCIAGAAALEPGRDELLRRRSTPACCSGRSGPDSPAAAA